jgi:hypothetical protein
VKPMPIHVFPGGVCLIRLTYDVPSWMLIYPPSVLRDQRDRGRDLEGIIKQWFKFVKPNFEKVRTPVSFFQLTLKLMTRSPVCQPSA